MKNGVMKKAEITAFLSLLFVLLVSFVLGILEISVIHTSKNMSRLSADRAVFSVFGEYQEKLLEDYHIFAIEGSYGTGDYTEDRMIGRMHYYGTESMEHEITEFSFSQIWKVRLSVNRFWSTWNPGMEFHWFRNIQG